MQQWVDSQMHLIDVIRRGKKSNPELYLSEPNRFTFRSEKELLQKLKEARIYEIDGRLGRIFSLTPNEPREIKLPFETIFLNLNINFNGTTIHGLNIEHIDLIDEDGDMGGNLKDVMIEGVYTKPINDEREEIGTIPLMLRQPVPEEKKINKERGGDICGLMRRIVMNFNDFLEHPEIKIVERKRTNQKQREKRGKIPLPNSTIVKVSGQLKIYVNSIAPNSKSDDEIDVGKCYEVAGHWRRFRHPKFINMQGKKRFIHPYVKGSGMPEIKRRVIKNTRLKGRTEVV